MFRGPLRRRSPPVGSAGARSATAGVAVALLLVLGAAGCSDTDDGNGSAAAPEQSRFADTRHCELARQLALGSGPDAQAPIRDFYAAFDEVGEEFVATAPTEIEADVQVFAEGVRSMREALEAIDYDQERFTPELVPELTDGKYAAAAENVVDFFTTECGLPSAGGSDPTPTNNGQQRAPSTTAAGDS